ncbi:ATP-binding protein [Archangium violaceum]|uniref:sensor histidine kinase n=1 Tax=Archangium violaceum TaxID=83451 RepID=UPI002B29A5B6|nr:ATP-binding protein [Archangium gephyra]
MQPTPRLRAPLARSTLIKMGARIAVVITLTTFFSYLHMLHTLRTEALAHLEQHVTERAQSEQGIFLLAEDNLAFIKRALEERIRALGPEDIGPRFDRLFVRMADGSVRSRPEGFDGTKTVGVFVPQGVKVDEDMRRRLLASYDVLTAYGPAFHVRFPNTYVTLPEGPIVIYWPEHPTWIHDTTPGFMVTQQVYFSTSLPENNPERRTLWTEVYTDEVSGKSMSSSTIPLDLDGRHAASISQDVMLEELVAHTINDHLPGAYNLLFRDDGTPIVQPHTQMDGEHLRRIIESVKTRPPGVSMLELPEQDEYLAVARLLGPGWNLVTVLPAHVVSQPAVLAARYVLLLGILSLALELAIMAWVLRWQITWPLLTFTQATDRIASGEFQVELDTSRNDELGQLAHSFQCMVDEVRRREKALREANESLEQRVEERTRELKDVHRQLVQSARRAGMAEIATNVLHNVGNVLNSVYTAAQLARERMTHMRLEHVGRVAGMLQEHQGDIGAFLSQDERGRNVLPFLGKLGQNLLEERKGIATLLDDVGRYTEHIGDIVKVQQNYARTPRVQEPVHLEALVEDALRINSAGLTRHQVKVVRQLEALPPVLTDKHKALMILVNLVSNAKYAMDGVPPVERTLSVKMERTPTGLVRIHVHDNGMGIAPEMLTRIFQYGFTTREEGHGFGLHSSALAAQELGGSLAVHSEGPGHGATFTMELPYAPAQQVA